MLSNKEIVCPENLLRVAKNKKNVTAGIVNAGKILPMHSAMEAVKENLITPIFIGDKNEIKKYAEQLKWDISKYEIINESVENNTASIAAKIASEGKIRIIVKGHIHTDVLMKEVLKREYNLLGKKRLSHIWHMTVDKTSSPLIITDGVLNVLPNRLYSLFKTSFIKISVWIWPLTIIFILFWLANLAAIEAVLFSIFSSIIS